MSLTSTAPLSLHPHATIDRPHQPSMSYPPADERNYQGYYGRPNSAHGALPLEVSSPERLHSSGAGAQYPKGSLPPPSPVHVYPSPHDVGPAPGSSHGYPAQTPVTPMSASAYPPQSPAAPYYGMNPQNPDPTLATAAAAGAAANPRVSPSFTTDGAPIVPVGISGGKMFRCRGFGECDKVFTRSEHLARHVRKHTGERPFPCHCGKAFSRLDNLRQHAATVHADAAQLNEAMLTSLASVHAALSQRANREQRRRGEVVEVPKNAVERPRGERGVKGAPVPGGVPPPGGVYPAPGYHPQQWGAPPDHGRPRTGGSWVEYPYPGAVTPVGEHPPPPGTATSVTYSDDAGPSRRPPSSGYPTGYYDQGPPSSSHGRPGTGNPAPPGTGGSDDSAAVQYGYRPLSSGGPGHYADSEPPSSAHGPPGHSPMYPHPTATVPTTGNWTSPPTPHSGYPADPSLYASAVPPADGQHPYPPGQGPEGYGPPPPGSSGGYYPYPPQGHGYYNQQSPAQQHQAAFAAAPGVPPSATAPPTSGYPQAHYGAPSDSPFQYNAPAGSYPYGPGYDTRKRRAEDEAGGDRKHPRSSMEGGPISAEPRAPGAPGEQLWLPPASERRSSLAISALLGSPTQDTHGRSRPTTGDMSNPGAYPYPGAPYDDRTGAARERPADGPDDKPKALVAE